VVKATLENWRHRHTNK